MQWSYPNYNFPAQPQSSGARQLFSNYGAGLLNSDNVDQLDSQRLRHQGGLLRQFMTVPLCNSPVEVPYPWKDRIMGEIIEKNRILESFTDRVSRIIGARKRSNNKKQIEVRELMTALDNYKQNPQDGAYENVAMNMPAWFTELLEQNEKIRNVKGPKNHNWRYTGGCLVGFQGNDTDSRFLVCPSGTDFDNISLHQLSENSGGVVRSKVMGSKTLPGTLYEARGQEFRSQNNLAVRLDSSCLMYSIDLTKEDSPFTLLRETEINTGIPTSVSLSTYIPEECLIATDQGQCYMWTGDGCNEVIKGHEPRFATEDRWRSCHFGAHPRQIVFTDTTVVQTYDLREAESLGHDIFALPNQLLHQKERIRLCEVPQQCPFYQFIATDYSLLFVDQRFPGHVVLKWDHMLSTPPQYMSITHPSPDSEDSIVYVGSQVPSEVHGFQLRIRGDKSPQSISVPWSVDRMRDILKDPIVIENISNVKALETRFNSSLSGIQALPWRSGHVVFQMDSHGDIFGQLWGERTTAADQHQLQGSAVQVAKEWVEALETQIKQCIKTSGRSVVKDVREKFEEIQQLRPVCTLCQLCLPSSTSSNIAQEEAFCLRCCFTVKQGRELLDAVKQDSMRPSDQPYNLPSGLADIDKLHSTSALSRLLLKQWNKDKDIQEELKLWDQEVLEFRKHRRKKKTELRSGIVRDSTLSNRTETDSHQNEEPESVRQSSLADASVSDSDTANQITEHSATSDANISLTNQNAEQIPANQKTEDSILSQDSLSDQNSALSNTPRITPSLNIPNILSQITTSKDSNSDRSLFSDSEVVSVSPRKRKRRLSQSSSVSMRSDISRASLQSFPGFLESPKHLKSSQNFKASSSSKSINISQEREVLENPDSRTSESDVREKLSSDNEFTDIFSGTSPLFRTPVKTSLIPLTRNISPVGKASVSAKVRKKVYKPGF